MPLKRQRLTFIEPASMIGLLLEIFIKLKQKFLIISIVCALILMATLTNGNGQQITNDDYSNKLRYSSNSNNSSANRKIFYTNDYPHINNQDTLRQSDNSNNNNVSPLEQRHYYRSHSLHNHHNNHRRSHNDNARLVRRPQQEKHQKQYDRYGTDKVFSTSTKQLINMIDISDRPLKKPFAANDSPLYHLTSTLSSLDYSSLNISDQPMFRENISRVQQNQLVMSRADPNKSQRNLNENRASPSQALASFPSYLNKFLTMSNSSSDLLHHHRHHRHQIDRLFHLDDDNDDHFTILNDLNDVKQYNTIPLIDTNNQHQTQSDRASDDDVTYEARDIPQQIDTTDKQLSISNNEPLAMRTNENDGDLLWRTASAIRHRRSKHRHWFPLNDHEQQHSDNDNLDNLDLERRKALYSEDSDELYRTTKSDNGGHRQSSRINDPDYVLYRKEMMKADKGLSQLNLDNGNRQLMATSKSFVGVKNDENFMGNSMTANNNRDNDKQLTDDDFPIVWILDQNGATRTVLKSDQRWINIFNNNNLIEESPFAVTVGQSICFHLKDTKSLREYLIRFLGPTANATNMMPQDVPDILSYNQFLSEHNLQITEKTITSNDTTIGQSQLCVNQPDDSQINGPLIAAVVSIVVPIVFTFIFVTGLLGNIIVAWVIIGERQRGSLSTTNILVLDLCAANILFIITCIPFTAWDYCVHHWIFGQVWCQINQYLIVVCALSSIYTLVLMSIDRFMAAVIPFGSMLYRTACNTTIAIFLKWFLILFFSYPVIERHEVNVNPLDNTLGCRFNTDRYDSITYQWIFFTTSYSIPLIIIVILYCKILLKIWCGTKPQGHTSSSKQLESRKKATLLVASIIGVFAICWGPIQVMLILMRYNIGYQTTIAIISQVFSHTLGYSNSCINPIVYALASDKFISDFRRSFWGQLIGCMSQDVSQQSHETQQTSIVPNNHGNLHTHNNHIVGHHLGKTKAHNNNNSNNNNNNVETSRRNSSNINIINKTNNSNSTSNSNKNNTNTNTNNRKSKIIANDCYVIANTDATTTTTSNKRNNSNIDNQNYVSVGDIKASSDLDINNSIKSTVNNQQTADGPRLAINAHIVVNLSEKVEENNFETKHIRNHDQGDTTSSVENESS